MVSTGFVCFLVGGLMLGNAFVCFVWDSCRALGLSVCWLGYLC